MGIEKLQKTIVNKEGLIFSDGTLNLEHLLADAYDILLTFDINDDKSKQIKKDIISVYKFNEEFGEDESLYHSQYYGYAELNEEKMDDANSIWNEDVFEYFCSIAPKGYIFGSSDGDGSLIGWFKDCVCEVCGCEFGELNEDGICEDCNDENEEEVM